ncbi:hypothetical protein HDK90DRAFT_357029 [Phyllosticta capitalensis]|uniref:Uncharacterized protein n=1 Tax=Phyllosticta capitalensis TaxID=121624 RepID=A0ABR1YIB8_9PEZI
MRSLLPLALPLLLTPFAVASPAPLAVADPALLPPAGNTCPCYPDNADDTYKGYLGAFRAVGFPYRIGCPAQAAQISEARIEDTVRRALGAPPVGPPPNVGTCGGLNLPYYQGTVYIGNVQIFVAWDDPGKIAYYCSVSSPQEDCVATFATPLCDRPAK